VAIQKCPNHRRCSDRNLRRVSDPAGAKEVGECEIAIVGDELRLGQQPAVVVKALATDGDE